MKIIKTAAFSTQSDHAPSVPMKRKPKPDYFKSLFPEPVAKKLNPFKGIPTRTDGKGFGSLFNSTAPAPKPSDPERSLFDKQPDWMGTIKAQPPKAELAAQYRQHLDRAMQTFSLSEEEAAKYLDHKLGHYPEFAAMRDADKALRHQGITFDSPAESGINDPILA